MSPGTECPEAAFVKDVLRGTRFERIEWIAETGSTNEDLLAIARQGAPEQVLITDLQTAGRGRRGRIWDAPARTSILMSTLLRGRPPEDGFWSVGAIALAASQAIDALVPVPSRLKWPNDVLLGDLGEQKKVAGVLAQVVDDAVIVGIGINVNWPDDVPAELSATGTAVNWNLAERSLVDRAALACDILQRAIGHLALSREDLRVEWMAQCSTMGAHVRVERERAPILGIAADIAENGALIVDEDGHLSTHQVGDVVHLRPR